VSLVEIPVRQLHQGVSRQPDHTRFPGQLQDAQNQLFRVEEAGFSKRFGSQYVAPVAPAVAANGANVSFQVIDLDANTKYGVSIGNGQISICNLLTGAPVTVNAMAAEAAAYINTDASNLVLASVFGSTIVVNKTIKTAMTSAVSGPKVSFRAVFHVIDGRPGVYSITIDGNTGSYTTSATDQTTWDTSVISVQLKNHLITALGAGYAVDLPQGGYIMVTKLNSTAMSVQTSDPTGGLSMRSTVQDDYVTSTDLLPAFALNGMRVFVGASGIATYYVSFTETPAASNRGYWSECLGAGVQYQIDQTTMPHQLLLNGDGSFTFQAIPWDNLQVGDNTTVPPPDFIGKTITDVVFHKDRLAILSGEWVWFSLSGNYYGFWPKYSTQQLDTDPFGLRGSANRVSLQRFAVPHRKIFWTTADSSQFEISSATTLTAKNTVMDYTTSYVCNPLCRPITMAQMLYFTSWNGGNAILQEYAYDYFTLTAIANDVTRHVRGYIPQPIVDMAADQPTGNLFLLSGADRSSLSVWTVYWNGTQREQSSWSQWNFPGGQIHGIRIADGVFYICITRPSGTYIEKIALADNGGIWVHFPYSPRLDQVTLVAGGTYDAVNNQTPFVLPLPADMAMTAVQGITGNNLPLKGVSGNTVYVAGNFQSQDVAIGYTYPSSITLSKQYLRDQQGTAIVNGVLQLQTMTIAHKDTGYYQVEVDVPGRAPMYNAFTARLLGDGTNLLALQPIVSGTFRGTVGGEGQTAVIKIHNDTHLPHTISEIVFRGTFNELVRQG
jgi:hypothetical protein